MKHAQWSRRSDILLGSTIISQPFPLRFFSCIHPLTADWLLPVTYNLSHNVQCSFNTCVWRWGWRGLISFSFIWRKELPGDDRSKFCLAVTVKTGCKVVVGCEFKHLQRCPGFNSPNHVNTWAPYLSLRPSYNSKKPPETCTIFPVKLLRQCCIILP